MFRERISIHVENLEETQMILVVDDDAQITTLLREALEREGYRVETAANGVQAFDLVKSPDCKCMLLDVNMPKINGPELLLLMQAEGIEVPTIVMAGFAGFEEDEMKQFGNVVTLIQKPFEMSEMLGLIKQQALPAKR